MGLVVVVLLVALLGARLCGGRLSRLAGLELRSWGLVVAGLAVQLCGGLFGGVAYPVCLALSAVLVLVFLARNPSLPGGRLLALGLLANALVVGLNGAMPVSPTGAARAGVPVPAAIADPRHELAGPDTRLGRLADVVPVPLPVVPQVVSPGDVLVAAGLGELVALTVLGRAGSRRRRVPGPARPHLPPIRR